MVANDGRPTLEWLLWLQNIGNSLEATGSVTTTGTEGIGYASGAGGTVTQGVSKSSGVSLNKATGQITTTADSLGAGATVNFTLSNTAIEATDLLIVNHVSGGTIGAYDIDPQPGAGNAIISLTNRTTSALAESIVIGFAIIKGANA